MDTARTGGSRFGRALSIVIGVGALLVGTWQTIETVRFLHRAVNATGRVVLAPGETGDMAGAHPTIEFIGPGGKPVRYAQNGMGGRKVGTRIPLLYDPAAPATTATATSFWQFWFPLLLPFWLALGFIGLPLIGVEME